MNSSNVDPGEVLTKYKVVAVVGASKNPEKDANSVPAYLMEHGYDVIPINPTADVVLGKKVYPSLASLPEEVAKTVDIVDVFRPSEELPDLARQVVEMKKRSGRPSVFWSQLGIENDDAKKTLEGSKVAYVMNACMRTEHMVRGMSRGYLQGRINSEWHDAHVMPQNPSREERVKWHAEHAEACGCRPAPENIADDVRVMIRKNRENRSANWPQAKGPL